MDTDFASLAASIAADISDLRGCVIVSRDGLVLGAHPEDAESTLRSAWLRFASLGEVEKGFLQFGGELWVYVRRGPYASFAVSGSVTRPGLVLDQLERVLETAEEARSNQGEPPQLAGGVPSSKPRTSLHPESKPAAAPPTPVESVSQPEAASASSAAPATDEPRVIQTPEATPAAQPPQATPQAQPPQAAPYAQPPQATPPAPTGPEPSLPVPPESGPPAPPKDDGSVDRVALAQEFAQLLGESGYDDEDSE